MTVILASVVCACDVGTGMQFECDVGSRTNWPVATRDHSVLPSTQIAQARWRTGISSGARGAARWRWPSCAIEPVTSYRVCPRPSTSKGDRRVDRDRQRGEVLK